MVWRRRERITAPVRASSRGVVYGKIFLGGARCEVIKSLTQSLHDIARCAEDPVDRLLLTPEEAH